MNTRVVRVIPTSTPKPNTSSLLEVLLMLLKPSFQFISSDSVPKFVKPYKTSCNLVLSGLPEHQWKTGTPITFFAMQLYFTIIARFFHLSVIPIRTCCWKPWAIIWLEFSCLLSFILLIRLALT